VEKTALLRKKAGTNPIVPRRGSKRKDLGVNSRKEGEKHESWMPKSKLMLETGKPDTTMLFRSADTISPGR